MDVHGLCPDVPLDKEEKLAQARWWEEDSCLGGVVGRSSRSEALAC